MPRGSCYVLSNKKQILIHLTDVQKVEAEVADKRSNEAIQQEIEELKELLGLVEPN